MPMRVKDAKIACIDFSLRKDKLSMGYQVVVQDTSQLEAIRDRESDIVAEKIKLILASGANVLLSSKGIDDLSLKYFVEAGCMAVRRVTKDDLRRIARATGANIGNGSSHFGFLFLLLTFCHQCFLWPNLREAKSFRLHTWARRGKCPRSALQMTSSFSSANRAIKTLAPLCFADPTRPCSMRWVIYHAFLFFIF